MAEFKYNEGKIVNLSIEKQYHKTKIYLSVDVIPENAMIKIAGYSIIDLYLTVQDVIFTDHPLDYAFKLYDKQIGVIIDATKFQTGLGAANASSIPIACKLTIEAGDDLLEEFVLDDTSNPTANSVFHFNFMFIPSRDE